MITDFLNTILYGNEAYFSHFLAVRTQARAFALTMAEIGLRFIKGWYFFCTNKKDSPRVPGEFST